MAVESTKTKGKNLNKPAKSSLKSRRKVLKGSRKENCADTLEESMKNENCSRRKLDEVEQALLKEVLL